MNSWKNLTHLQLGKCGEHLASIEFIKSGLDVFTSEVDDKGIDLVVRKNENTYYDIQVKAIRGFNYVFMRKEVFKPRKNLYLALLIFNDEIPTKLLIPSTDISSRKHSCFSSRDYIGKKSQPEYGISLSKKNITDVIELYSFDKQIRKL